MGFFFYTDVWKILNVSFNKVLMFRVVVINHDLPTRPQRECGIPEIRHQFYTIEGRSNLIKFKTLIKSKPLPTVWIKLHTLIRQWYRGRCMVTQNMQVSWAIRWTLRLIPKDIIRIILWRKVVLHMAPGGIAILLCINFENMCLMISWTMNI